LPQAPQLPASLRGSTQLPLQATSPVAHVHAENRHVRSGPQELPHPPQFCGSPRVLTQAPAQTVWFLPQPATQRPLLQT
jgi:hypothetical protein